MTDFDIISPCSPPPLASTRVPVLQYRSVFTSRCSMFRADWRAFGCVLSKLWLQAELVGIHTNFDHNKFEAQAITLEAVHAFLVGLT